MKITKLQIVGDYDPSKVMQVEIDSCETRPEGMLELFADLARRGQCESYNAGRIYYLAYLLAENYPELTFEVTKEG